MSVAAIDCGTNSIRLLVADADEAGGLVERTRLLEFVGLGRGVDATGRLDPAAIDRALATCRRYAALIQESRCDKVRLVATSAVRDAANRDGLLGGLAGILGPLAVLDVIDGDEEARLSFSGALSGAPLSGEPVLVMDAGGGSTELVRGRADGTILQSISLDIGSRRLKERELNDDPPTEAQICRARAAVRRGIGQSGVDLESVRTFIGVAGTVTSLAALALCLPEYDREQVHGARLSLETITTLSDRLLSLSQAEIAALGPVQPQRAAVLAAGALIVDEVAQHVGTTALVVSEADILDGIALDLLGSPPQGALPQPS